PAPARHYAAPVAATQTDGELQNAGKNDRAFGLIQQVLRYVVGYTENLGNHFPRVAYSLRFLLLRVGRQRGQREQHSNSDRSFHQGLQNAHPQSSPRHVGSSSLLTQLTEHSDPL